jgi:RNA-binding protein 39
MGLPIMVQLTESERNKTHAGDGYVSILIQPASLTDVSVQESPSPSGSNCIPWCNVGSLLPCTLATTDMLSSLYVGSLHFNLTESDIKQVFEPFGELEFVDLHRDPTTGRSKGYAFVQ